MEIAYTVHSSNAEPHRRRAMVDGAEVDVTVQGHTVELVGKGETITLRVGPADAAEAAKLFPIGAAIVATFQPGAAAKAE